MANVDKVVISAKNIETGKNLGSVELTKDSGKGLTLSPKDISFNDLKKDGEGFLIIENDKLFELLNESYTLEAEIKNMKEFRKQAFEMVKPIHGLNFRVMKVGQDLKQQPPMKVEWVESDPKPEISKG